MHIKGRTLSLHEGKLSTSDVLYKAPSTKSVSQESETKTEEVIIVDETNKESNVPPQPQPTE